MREALIDTRPCIRSAAMRVLNFRNNNISDSPRPYHRFEESVIRDLSVVKLTIWYKETRPILA
jgi:hypothetical protein